VREIAIQFLQTMDISNRLPLQIQKMPVNNQKEEKLQHAVEMLSPIVMKWGWTRDRVQMELRCLEAGNLLCFNQMVKE
jgi:hypothetical protein